MKIIFWSLIFLTLYCYIGYPLFLGLIARLHPRFVRKSDFTPTVSVVLSVYNEEYVIEGKIKNLLSLDYPADRLEIVIGSDGSTDKTNEIIKKFTNSRITLLASDAQRGKMATINEIARHAKNEIIVFTDARQTFEKTAVSELVRNFSDPKVGCVSGELMLSQEKSTTAKGLNLYWNYEKLIRTYESEIHSMIGATGAIYAIRRELYTDAPPHVVLDDVYIPLKIVLKGFRAVFDHAAKAYDRVNESPYEEHQRKARTLFGNYQIFFMIPDSFNPFKSPIAIQIFSHKLLRVLIPFFLMAVFLINMTLASERLYQAIFFLQLIFYIMAIIGFLARYANHGIVKCISRICAVPYVFCLLNFSALTGFFRFLCARQDAAWKKAR